MTNGVSALPPLASYTSAQLNAASEWPAIARYLRILDSHPLESDLQAKNLSSVELTVDDLFRLRRHKLWLESALATYFDRPTAQDTCFHWSQAAENLIADAWAQTGLDQGDYALLALGKLGAEELNLSSDVDLILVRADSQVPSLKAMRAFQNLLSEITAFGFALRVDFTLRPGGAASPAIPSVTELENYYGYQGETWERLAFVRMRVIAGPTALARELSIFAKKYSYRKHLDYTLLEELKSLRNKIRRERFETRPETFHLKLGPGGIRELELFVHALQVIHGGRNPDMQTHSTTRALEWLGRIGLLPKDEVDFLIESYWYLRRLENRLHAFEDQQTYIIDLRNPSPALPPNFLPELQSRCARVIEIATSLFGVVDATPAAEEMSDSLEAQQVWLSAHGFSSVSCQETWPELLKATALSKKSDRDEAARQTFLKNFSTRLAATRLDRDLGLSLLLDFVRAIRAKASFFTLLNHEPRVVENLVQLFSTSPYLSSILCSRPELIDEFIYRKQAAPSQDLGVLLEELAERRLLVELIAANHYVLDRNLTHLSLNLTDTADAICNLLLERLAREYAPSLNIELPETCHESETASEISMIAMGKWGGRELGLRSDLDFIFVVPNEPTNTDQKIAKRMLARITESHRGGSIYAVDMRLRPSGHAGPVLVSRASLDHYLENQAAAWERQAYLRSRPLKAGVSSPAESAAKKGLSESDIQELKMIREKLLHESKPGELDLKLACGGLADIEFTAQIALLAKRAWTLDTSTAAMIQYMESIDAAWKKAGPFIREAYSFLREVEQLFQLTTSQSGSKMRVKSDEFKRLGLVLDSSPVELENRIRLILVQVQEELSPLRIT